MQSHRWRGLVRVLELPNPRLEESDVLFEEARTGHFATDGVLAIVGPAVSNAASAGGLVSIASLRVRTSVGSQRRRARGGAYRFELATG